MINLQIGNGDKTLLVQVATSEDEQELYLKIDGSYSEWNNVDGLIVLYIIEESLKDETLSQGKKYTRQGMIKRMLEERMDKATKADYKVFLADNRYGEHTLVNDKEKTFQVTLWDFEKKMGYINNIDWKTNKLGTTKHIPYRPNR